MWIITDAVINQDFNIISYEKCFEFFLFQENSLEIECYLEYWSRITNTLSIVQLLINVFDIVIKNLTQMGRDFVNVCSNLDNFFFIFLFFSSHFYFTFLYRDKDSMLPV